MPIEWIQQQQQWNQPQQIQPWDNSIPVENNWDFRRPAPQENNWDFRRPVEQPQQPWDNTVPLENNWDFRRPAPQPQQPWDNSIPNENNWDFRRPLQNLPWANQPIRVPPQPIESEPWLIRTETRCPQPQENSYHWALIIPHVRDQSLLTLCMGGVGSKFY